MSKAVVPIGICAAGLLLFARYSGKSPLSLLIVFVLLGMAVYVFSKVTGAVQGNLTRTVG
jgi:F0F1-type ATP synthase assembly protein I